MDQQTKQALIAHLAEVVTPSRRTRIETALALRTRYVAAVLEDVYQPQNASAVLRTCEALGVQDVHVVEALNRFEIRRNVVQGADKWLTIRRYNQAGEDNTRACLGALKSEGYRIVATTLREESMPLGDLSLETKAALCFGAEERGLSEVAHEMADVLVRIPMHGFTRSFNISVAAALCLREFTERLHGSDVSWQLTEGERMDLRLEWLTKSVPNGSEIARRFLQERAPGGGAAPA